MKKVHIWLTYAKQILQVRRQFVSGKWWVMPGLNRPPPRRYHPRRHHPTAFLVICLHPKRVLMCCCRLLWQSRQKRIQHALSVVQWFVGNRASWHPHCRTYHSIYNTEKRFPDSSTISGCLRLIKDFHHDTHAESKWLMLAFVLYYRPK